MQVGYSKNRIWEIDFVRGVAILIVVLLHMVYYLNKYTVIDWQWPMWLWYFKQYAGLFFVLLSGLCIAFAKSSFKRGLIVFACGLFISAWTSIAYYKFGDPELIRWGALHLIGFCMMLYPLIKKLPRWAQLAMALALIIAGYYIKENFWTLNPYLFPLGIQRLDFMDADWFPILPNIGWFIFGVWLKDLIYPTGKSLLPSLNPPGKFLGLFCWLGRKSLIIYMVHMPLLYLLVKANAFATETLL